MTHKYGSEDGTEPLATGAERYAHATAIGLGHDRALKFAYAGVANPQSESRSPAANYLKWKTWPGFEARIKYLRRNKDKIMGPAKHAARIPREKR